MGLIQFCTTNLYSEKEHVFPEGIFDFGNNWSLFKLMGLLRGNVAAKMFNLAEPSSSQ